MSDAEYGPTVIPSVVDTENDAKNVNADAKELIAKCISQCNQADVSCRQLLSFQLQNSISSTIMVTRKRAVELGILPTLNGEINFCYYYLIFILPACHIFMGLLSFLTGGKMSSEVLRLNAHCRKILHNCLKVLHFSANIGMYWG
jgi:hypothetical protein